MRSTVAMFYSMAKTEQGEPAHLLHLECANAAADVQNGATLRTTIAF